MVLTYSQMLPLGTKLPEFNLINTINNQEFSSDVLSDNKGKLIMFICNHCPFVIHYHQQIIAINKKYGDKIDFVAISSNDIKNYPEDAPDKMQKLWQDLGLDFPYLYDESQKIATKYQAVCTPEFYLFNQNNQLIYRGRMDGSSPNNAKEASGIDLKNAIDNFLANKEINPDQYPSMGCNIKKRFT